MRLLAITLVRQAPFYRELSEPRQAIHFYAANKKAISVIFSLALDLT